MTESNSTRERSLRRARAPLALAAVATAALLTAACSSSGSSSAAASGSSGTAAGSTASGTPVVIGSIYPVGTAGQNDPAVGSAMNAAALALNKTGGISGHPIKIVTCNAGTDPNTASACARTLVSDKAVAAVRDYAPLAPDQVTDILKASGIPEVFSDPLSNTQYNSPNFFPADGGSAWEIAASMDTAKAAGYTKIAISTAAVPATVNIINLTKQAAKVAGIQVVNTTLVPVTATDMSSYAQSIVSSGAQAAFIGLFDNQQTAIMQGIVNDGATNMAFYGTDVEYTPVQYAPLGAAIEKNMRIVGPIPPITAAAKFPVLQQFVKELAAEDATGDATAALNQAGSQSIEGWAGVHLIATLLKGKAMTAASLTTQLNSAKNINTGLFPPWTPSTPGPSGFTRISQVYDYSSTISNGAPHLASTTPINVATVLGFS
jgi:ABC-type branched-subunit amino acid transport system substrate-binding protein